jgi:hypothetical protein
MKKTKLLLACILSALIGGFIFFILYGELLNPFYDAWLLIVDPDIAQAYIGWAMYRVADWSYPIGLAVNYAHPIGVAVTYTDSIPLFAIVFKIFRNFLPDTFQYFGLWIGMSFILQSIFGFLLLNNFLKKKSLAVLGSAIFVLSPIMLFRLGGHFALGGQWLILAGLYLLFRKHDHNQWWQWSLLLLLSLTVHPYLFFMNAFLMITDLLMLLKNKSINIFKLALFLIIEAFFIYNIAYALGLFTVSQAYAAGYGNFSMNLNALFNPLGWSNVLPDLDITKYQTEGFNYLGLGILFLLLLSLWSCLKKKCFKILQWPIVLFITLSFLLSISNIVSFGNKILFTLPLPEAFINNFLGLFRSSGRFFWPVFYMIVLASFYIIKTSKYKKAIIILIIAISLQVYDLSGVLAERGKFFENKVQADQFFSLEFETAAQNYKRMAFLPVLPYHNYMFFAMYASQHNLTLNNGSFARPINEVDKYIENQIKSVEAGNLDQDTIYVFTYDADNYTANIDLNEHWHILIDDTFVLFPYYDSK